jgi:hypothetical protein
MSVLFKKPTASPAPAPLTNADRLIEIEKEFRQAEVAYVDACSKVSAYNGRVTDLRTGRINGETFVLFGAMSHDRELQRLESVKEQARRRRSELLGQRAELMKSFGMI